MKSGTASALTGTLLYALIGGIWILFSDKALNAAFSDPGLINELQTFKGWFYVAVTSLLLYALLRRAIKDTTGLLINDPLTLLPRHYQFSLSLQAILSAAPDDKHVVMMDVDINDFSKLNEQYGHHFADQILRHFAHELRDDFPEGTLLGRLGPDSFGVAIMHTNNEQHYDHYVQQVFKSLKNVSAAFEVDVQASIGIAIAPEDGQASHTLMTHATSALHSIKGKGAGLFCYFSRELSSYQQLRQDIVRALRSEGCFAQFSLVYQPQFKTLSGAISGVEVLARWQHPEHGAISPALFIPIAEEIGAAHDISKWVISTAEQELRQTGVFNAIPRISINISATEFNDEHQLKELAAQFADSAEFAKRCQLEITETAALQNLNHSQTLIESLKNMGLRFSIDDFGTGYTSLAMLKNLPIDEIKIDRAFIATLHSDTNTQKVVRSIIDIAQNFGINSVAEGVEIQEHVDFLKANHCSEIQGYFFAKPMTADALSAMVLS